MLTRPRTHQDSRLNQRRRLAIQIELWIVAVIVIRGYLEGFASVAAWAAHLCYPIFAAIRAIKL